MRHIMTRLALTGSGALLGLIGGSLMFDPSGFLKASGVLVDADPGLMSELTAPSVILILAGGLMLFAAVKFRFARLALFVGAGVYGSYGIGRLISMSIHGLPPESLIVATIVEFAVAALLSGLGFTHRIDQTPSEATAHLIPSSL